MIDGQDRVRITDFGLAGLAEKFQDDDVRVGTPAYMAPEQSVLTAEEYPTVLHPPFASVPNAALPLGLLVYAPVAKTVEISGATNTSLLTPRQL